ncbi:unnamed protein product [Prunus armeniaca]|uniref:Uncharacterized protein n=1 Tax=Prunus armeniaca TaxID=36596 RepID=A0A6J5WSL3_PRUAR|nr:unnamed protein product [Prunus armeniaca]CAB4304716.1 unnamed protein product [Prunus armeniaca]
MPVSSIGLWTQDFCLSPRWVIWEPLWDSPVELNVDSLGKAWISAAFDFAVHNLLVFGCLQRCSSFRDRFSDVKVEAKTLREGLF